ncbi:Uncharacterized conserved protein, contains DUF4213 and DUF364 domains [Thiothrix eikelboomii]|uniref:Uncharacterized conserved protein, contains DUF4213 and DUF364 domains n=1 Tax=Thiothrix eikelboomii TaxID=92487 RepID=A0A1T4XZL2_9GAMM|nr:DUF364 domain-containing protein [Thiothrix eikelboomii]SKA94956.1 Uncharacterized conserved protein, contains DUF4213 and DUF364 domains [Thiothrix eikelboomii]
MSLDADYLALVEQIRAGLSLPAVQRLYFPCLTTEGFRDEFGFVLLTTGDVGAFYVSLEDSLAELWQAYPQPEQVQVPLDTLLAKLASSQLAERALGLGAFNALSQYVFRLAHYQAPSRQRAANTSTEHIKLGMVGYFCPLVERLTAQQQTVVVLEQQPERVLPHPLVQLATNPADLAECSEILCTASTLINQSLDSILAACEPATRFSLIGPSAGGLPDVVFARGVDSVGAIHFPNPAALLEVLAGQASWGHVGKKYEINRADYPGLAALLARIPPKHS